MELDWVLQPEGWAESHSILVCALSTFRAEPDDLSTPEDPHGLIAPFARRNFYAAAASMLRSALSPFIAELSIPRKSVRIFSNSRIPEKPLLAAAGLAWIGSNGLAIAPVLGSRFVIAGAVLPIPSRQMPASAFTAAEDPCGSCALCVEACPAGAIVERGLVDPDRCLQGLASRAVPFAPKAREAWGSRLYGCQDCQSACPYNKAAGEESRVSRGEIGPSVPLRTILSLDIVGMRAFFKKTPMGMSWVSTQALLRNALIAAGNRRETSLAEAVSRHTDDAAPGVREAARWALERLTGRPFDVDASD